VKVIVHAQITRVTSIYHSYFLYNIVFLEKPIYIFPGLPRRDNHVKM
jgi:hypothetical protein